MSHTFVDEKLGEPWAKEHPYESGSGEQHTSGLSLRAVF